MLEENTGRSTGTMSYASHENPVWYNFLTLIWGWIPWTLVFVASLFTLKRGRRVQHQPVAWHHRVKALWHSFRQQDPLQLFCWLAVLLIFVFYCIGQFGNSGKIFTFGKGSFYIYDRFSCYLSENRFIHHFCRVINFYGPTVCLISEKSISIIIACKSIALTRFIILR